MTLDIPLADDPHVTQPKSTAGLLPDAQTVTAVRHWTDGLFSFRVTRPASLRFRSGEFVMIGLPGEDGAKPVLRAYSIASPCWDEQLEFFSIKVPDGPLTSRLQKIQVGDRVLMGKKPTGTLVLDALTGGERLWLIGTGTGLAPWLSVARDPDTYARFGRVIVCHTVRNVADLSYRDFLTSGIHEDPLIGDEAKAQLTYYPTVTREAFERQGRFTDAADRLQTSREFDFALDSAIDPAYATGIREAQERMAARIAANDSTGTLAPGAS